MGAGKQGAGKIRVSHKVFHIVSLQVEQGVQLDSA